MEAFRSGLYNLFLRQEPKTLYPSYNSTPQNSQTTLHSRNCTCDKVATVAPQTLDCKMVWNHEKTIDLKSQFRTGLENAKDKERFINEFRKINHLD